MSRFELLQVILKFYLLNIRYQLRFDGETYTNIARPSCRHSWTMAIAIYRGQALTTGNFWGGPCSVRTELYDFERNQWQTVADYPFAP